MGLIMTFSHRQYNQLCSYLAPTPISHTYCLWSLSSFLIVPLSHKWEKTCGICLSESSLFSLTSWSPVYPFSCKLHDFVLFNDWIMLHCVYMYHIFLIHTDIDGHLRLTLKLAIVNSAVTYIILLIQILSAKGLQWLKSKQTKIFGSTFSQWNWGHSDIFKLSVLFFISLL
jgi:hypothetical protein